MFHFIWIFRVTFIQFCYIKVEMRIHVLSVYILSRTGNNNPYQGQGNFWELSLCCHLSWGSLLFCVPGWKVASKSVTCSHYYWKARHYSLINNTHHIIFFSDDKTGTWRTLTVLQVQEYFIFVFFTYFYYFIFPNYN